MKTKAIVIKCDKCGTTDIRCENTEICNRIEKYLKFMMEEKKDE